MRWRRNLVAVSSLVVTSVVAPALAFHDEIGSVSSGCPTGRWGFNTAGRPVDFTLGDGPRAALFREDQGWRLRFTGSSTGTRKVHHFHGTVTATDGFGRVRAVRIEGRDRVSLGAGGIKFSLRTGSKVDGFNFRPGCSESITVTIYKGDYKLRPRRILVGRLGNAYENPVHVTRVG